MWYAIVGGLGLAVGLGLMIWALRERNARLAAERAADRSDKDRLVAVDVANANAAQASELAEANKRIEAEVALLRGRLNEARVRLAETGDPKAVKGWLDSELGEETL